MDLKQFCQSKTCKGAIIGIAGLLVLLVVFQAGLFVGYHKARFSNGWGNRYEETFGHRGGMPMMGMRPGFTNPHGAVGHIVSITLPTFVLADQDGTEKVILLSDKTEIRRLRDTVKPSDLAVGDSVVVIGEPDDQSQVAANLIRVMPAMKAPAAASAPDALSPAPAPSPNNF